MQLPELQYHSNYMKVHEVKHHSNYEYLLQFIFLLSQL